MGHITFLTHHIPTDLPHIPTTYQPHTGQINLFTITNCYLFAINQCVCQSVHGCPFICPSVYVHLSLCSPYYLSVRLLPVRLFVSIRPWPIYWHIHLWTHPSFHRSYPKELLQLDHAAVALTQISGYSTAYAKSGIQSQHVSNHTWGYGAPSVKILFSHFCSVVYVI